MYIRADWGRHGTLPYRKPRLALHMPKKISDVAIEMVPSLRNRISSFQSKLAIAHYAHGTITDYCHALYKAVVYIGKLPDDFSQDDVDGYLQSMLSRKPMPAEAQFKHFVYGLKCYRQTMGCPELRGLSLPKIRREKKLPRILSFQQVMRLLGACSLYSKTLLSVIYDCGLRAFEACNLKWNDINFDRQQVHVKKGKGGKNRIVPVSPETLIVLKVYRKNYPSKNCIFKKFGKNVPITPDFIRARLKEGLAKAELDTWGSNRFYHPHIHCIVTGGGVDKKGVWHHLDGCKGFAKDFLFPVRALSKVFRAKFLSMLTSALKNEKELIPQEIRKKCMGKSWVVYSRPPAKGVNQVLEYIGRYAYRVAISNSRIKNYSPEGMVTYDWKDYRHNFVHKQNTMHAVRFLHLFSMHILPPAFVRIRHYGLLSPSNRDKVRKVQAQLGGKPVPKMRTKKSYMQICEEKGWEIGLCPHCKCRMRVIEILEPSRAPPSKGTSSRSACL